MDMKTNGSNVWPYVVVGSAIGGAVGYLFMTESGRRVRHAISHPDELSRDLEGARNFVERKARIVSDQVHRVLDKTKRSIEDGERAYREADLQYKNKARQIEHKNDQIATNVHDKVDKVTRTAVIVEHSIVDPLLEIGALFRGIEKGVRSLLGKNRDSGPIRINRDDMAIGL